MSNTSAEPEISPPALDQLLHDLDSRDNARRQKAMDQARALSPKALLQLAEIEAQHYRQRLRRVNSAFAMSFPVSIVLFLLILHTSINFPLSCILILALLTGWKLSDHYVPIRGRRSLVEIIEETQDLRLFETALRLSTDENTDLAVRNSARVALKRLLPQILQAGLVSQYLQNHSKALKALLIHHDKDLELTLAVLKALEQVGDESVIGLVAVLAIKPSIVLDTLIPIEWTFRSQVHVAAEKCLSCLQLRVKEAKQTQTLLRPSASPADAHTLLHPTPDTTNVVPPVQLLRIADLSETQESEAHSNPQAVQESAPLQEQWLHASKEEEL